MRSTERSLVHLLLLFAKNSCFVVVAKSSTTTSINKAFPAHFKCSLSFVLCKFLATRPSKNNLPHSFAWLAWIAYKFGQTVLGELTQQMKKEASIIKNEYIGSSERLHSHFTIVSSSVNREAWFPYHINRWSKAAGGQFVLEVVWMSASTLSNTNNVVGKLIVILLCNLNYLGALAT